jgi:NAD(P)-dependent dehydrogenase (short-subunit alcohol dehydrogenase family)
MIDYHKKFSLVGKTAAILGGSGLLGAEIAAAMAQAGAHTVILDVHAPSAETCSDVFGVHDGTIGYIDFDVTEVESIEDRFSALWADLGGMDVLVNSSYPRTPDWGAPVEDVRLDSWRRNVDMQLNSVFAVTRAACELMRAAKREGSIINLGSIYGVVGNDFTLYENTAITPPPAYSAIKGGVTSLGRFMASHYGRHGIRVNTLCPGGIEDGQGDPFVEQYSRRTPLWRMGRPDEVAAAALFLACDASSYITGTAFMVDGGWTAI